MTAFILNDNLVSLDSQPGTTLLDVIRYRQNLKGTKIGCREGDCGACTVLVGEWKNGEMKYRSMTSCLLASFKVHGKHVVTIEGINGKGLNPVQHAMAEEGATQCGFCTPGFVMSLAGFCMNNNPAKPENILASIDGNICRCTGYKSIERAAARILDILSARKNEDAIAFAIRHDFIPRYFETIPARLSAISPANMISTQPGASFVAGGTDLYVQQPEQLEAISQFGIIPHDDSIILKNGRCELGASVTVTDLKESEVFNNLIPAFKKYSKLISSTPIRNMATVAGNFINASPIGDLSIFFLALQAEVELTGIDNGISRRIALKNFFRSYKEIDRKPNEYISRISFPVPPTGSLFHFEKVSKRMHLDIASVNTAISLVMEGTRVREARLSAGGVAPVPLFLEEASAFLSGKEINASVCEELLSMLDRQVAPISDARGSSAYKLLLLKKLVHASLLHFFPPIDKEELSS